MYPLAAGVPQGPHGFVVLASLDGDHLRCPRARCIMFNIKHLSPTLRIYIRLGRGGGWRGGSGVMADKWEKGKGGEAVAAAV